MTANTDELFCILLALEGERLLLPRQALVEAVAWVELLPMPGAPVWYIALVRAVGDRIPGRLLGVVVQGFPQTLRVTRESLKPDEAALPPERGPVLSRVRMVNEAAVIPDLESLEAMVADETVSR